MSHAKEEFSVGDTVYTADGAEHVFFGIINGDNYVNNVIYEYGNGESYVSDVVVKVGKLFKKEPTQKYGDMNKSLIEKIAENKKKLCEIEGQIINLENKKRHILEGCRKYPDLQTAVDIMDGKITHFVIMSSLELRIQTFEEAMNINTVDGRGKLKLIALLGNRGKFTWSINRYYDGSGHYTDVQAFKSEDEARAFVQNKADIAFDVWRDNPDMTSGLQRFVDAGFAPDEYLDTVRDRKRRLLEEKIEKSENQLNSLKKELSNLQRIVS